MSNHTQSSGDTGGRRQVGEEEVARVLVQSPTEERNPLTTDIDTAQSSGIVATLVQVDQSVAEAVAATQDHITALVDEGVKALAAGGRIYYVGAGTSGRLAVLDAAELLPTYQVGSDRVRAVIAGGQAAMVNPVEGAEDDAEEGARALAEATARDLVIGLAASGRTPYVAGALRQARSVGAATGLIACNPNAPIAADVDVAVLVNTGPEAVTGSTRMKAGTAQKLVLNTFSTAVMIRSGKVYSNLMIDVLATNEKLRGRVVHLLQQATDLDEQTCARALEDTSTLRAALVSLLGGVEAKTAEEILAAFPADPARAGDPSGVRSAIEAARAQAAH